MPLYEEKMICPLAVRFTQEHIRPIFQNGMELERTISEIKTKPGSGSYDVILDTPFHAIEIVRWHKRDLSAEEPEGMHWLTFDNRRLYCLQRAATALWPQRVGVAVQALYAATNGYERKDNSMTAGRRVSIGHSPKLLTDRWDWRSAIPDKSEAAAAAFDLVAQDDALAGVEDLADAPAAPSMLELFFRQGEEAKATSEERSTADASSPRSFAGASEAADGVAEGFAGRWRGARSEVFEVRRTAHGLVCSSSGARRGGLWRDAQTDLVWWGNLFAEGSEVRSQSGRVRWYGDDGSWTPRMTWHWLGEDLRPPAAAGATKNEGRQQRRKNGGAHRAA